MFKPNIKSVLIPNDKQQDANMKLTQGFLKFQLPFIDNYRTRAGRSELLIALKMPIHQFNIDHINIQDAIIHTWCDIGICNVRNRIPIDGSGYFIIDRFLE